MEPESPDVSENILELNRSENSSEKQVKEAKSKCKTIASLLTASPNPNSRGVLMFKKRRQRAKKFTLTSFGNIEKVAFAVATEGTDEESLPTTSESELEEEEERGVKERRGVTKSKFESIGSVPDIVPRLPTAAKLESDFGNLQATAMMVQQNLEETQMCNGTTEAQSDEWVFYGIDENGAAVLNNAEQAQTRIAEMESPQLQQIHPQKSQRSQCKETDGEGNHQVTVGKRPDSISMTLPCSDYQSTNSQTYGLGTLSNVTLKAPLSCNSTIGGIKCKPALQVLNRTARPFTPGVSQEAAGTPLSPLSPRSKQFQAMQPQRHGKGFPSEQENSGVCNNSILGTVSTKVQNAKTTSSKQCIYQKPAARIQTNVEPQFQPPANAARMHPPPTPRQTHIHEALSKSKDVPRIMKVASGINEPQQTQRSPCHPIAPSVSKSILTSSLNRNVFPDGDDKSAMTTSLHPSDSPSPQKDAPSDGSTVTPFSPEPPPEISSREQRIIIPAARTGILQEVKKRNERKPDKAKMFTFKEVQKNSPNPDLLSLVQNLDDKGKGLDVEHEDDSLGLGAEAANFSQVHKANKSPPPVAPKPVAMTNQDSSKIYNSHSTSVSPGTAHNCTPAIGSPLAQSLAENYTFGTTTRVGPSFPRKMDPPPSPSVLSCRIAEMKGKGAELFARRQNRMERFVVGNIPEDPTVNGRGPSPTPSLPASWKYSSQIRAPPPICYNPILSPFYPPAAVAKGRQGGGATRIATKPPGKGKGGSKCKMEKMDIMKHQPYQLNSAMFTYSSKNTAKVKAIPQMPASTQSVAEPRRSFSNVHQKSPISVTSQLQMEVRGVPASQNVNSESSIIILPQNQQDRQSTGPVQSPALIQKQPNFEHLQNQSRRSAPSITTRQGPVTAIVSPVKVTTTDERQFGRVGPTPFIAGLDHSARQSPSLYQAPRPTFSAKTSGVKPRVWQPQAGQP
uniref:synaptopodin-2-like isoform X2 n=1 Tax=Myxine glutinosa TaxID=7769 RepID=UPI00358E4916